MPYKDPEMQRAYQAQWRQEHLFDTKEYQKTDAFKTSKKKYESRKLREAKDALTFVGVDGEGHGEGPEHNYFTLRAGDRLLRTGKPLRTDECLAFLSLLDPEPVYVIFFGTYDFTMILRGLPPEVLDDLFNRAGRAVTYPSGYVYYKPVKYKGFELDYIPKKRFTIKHPFRKKRIHIHDVGGFFQGSFISAITAWEVASPQEMDIIVAGKAGRGDWDALSDETDEYNHLECTILARLMEKMNRATNAVGLNAAPFEGAGNLASSMFEVYVASPHRKKGEAPQPPKPPAHVPTMGGYYGGRFESSAHGPIHQPVYEYDIVSAYPFAMLSLPCLWHGKWVHSYMDGWPALGYISWQVREGADRDTWGPVPVRHSDGSITYPLSGQGWYWSVEWPDTVHYDVDVLDQWSFVPECDHKPYDWINNVFNARRELGKTGKGYILKLGMNSLYGKTAQSVGQAPWANPALAGLITAITRRRMRDAADTNPHAVIMFATDAVFSLEPLNIPIGSDLGDWELTEYENMHMVQPGIYFDSTGAKVKTRGVGQRTLLENRDRIIDAFNAINTGVELTKETWGTKVDYNGLITLKLAHSQHRLDKAGYFGKLTRGISYFCEPKRPIHSLHREGNIWRSDAPSGSRNIKSKPYRLVVMPDHAYDEMVEESPEELRAQQYRIF